MLCFSCPVRWHGIALSNLLTGTAWRCISAVSKLVTTKLVSQVEWRIGVDTACAGCRRVEQRVAVKSIHTCEQRQLVTAVTWVEQQVQWWGTGCYSQEEEMGKHEEKAYLVSYYSRTCISLHDNLSGKISLQIYPFCACIPLQHQGKRKQPQTAPGISLLPPFLPASFWVLFRLVLFNIMCLRWKIV